ncbi:MAG: polyphosphate polymerase domain-containing protein [Oscillospiraceae bacterium]|nr:polyphosphate polymerase domain-containing protein [Oscillospiraceae bacterium]
MCVKVENPIEVMSRYEIKYILSPGQTEMMKISLEGHMLPDAFGKTSIASVYYDTPDYRLIRACIEKPAFKEKMRLRSYGLATDSSPVFLELKRKADGIVYKRRIRSTIPAVRQFVEENEDLEETGQIEREINYFKHFYEDLQPACLIIYDRTAYFEEDGDLRLTIDENPRYRFDDISLTHNMEGDLLLPYGSAILEVKAQNSIPLWLTHILSEHQIYQGSFSKYGSAYLKEIA